MPWRSLRFRFTGDGRPSEGPAAQDAIAMSVTYVGRVNRKAAEADARRRFEEWRRLPDLSRRWACDQLVVS
jgi:hypothetical protein